MGNTTNTTRFSVTVGTDIQAGPREVWEFLVTPRLVGELFWGSTVESDFKVGHPIVWKGTWEGKPFEDKGVIRQLQENQLLQCTHWSPSSGPDVEENYSLLTWRVSQENGGVRVAFQHENIATEQMRDHSKGMWEQLLARLKERVEKKAVEMRAMESRVAEKKQPRR